MWRIGFAPTASLHAIARGVVSVTRHRRTGPGRNKLLIAYKSSATLTVIEKVSATDKDNEYSSFLLNG